MGGHLWWVLDDAGFLFSEELLQTEVYHSSSSSSITWAQSYLREYLNGINNQGGSSTLLDKLFTQKEQSAILESEIVTPENPSYHTQGGPNTKDKLFLLSLQEIENSTFGFTNNNTRKNGDGSNLANWYWLRSSGVFQNFASCVEPFGNVNAGGSYVENAIGYVRPAFYMDPSAVVLTSSDKEDTVIKDFSGLPGIKSYEGGEWKVTLQNNDFRKPNVSNISRNKNRLTFQYSQIETGKNHKLSAMITTRSGSEERIVSYGVLADASSLSSGSVSVTLPSDFDDQGYALKLFSEQVNGEKDTDYTSELVEVSVPPAIKEIATVAITDLMAPVAGEPFDTAAKCETEGIDTSNITVDYETSRQAVRGNAAYNTEYTIAVTLKTLDSYTFTDATEATIEGNRGDAFYDSSSQKLTIKYSYPATKKATLIRIITPDKITGIANGTKMTKEALGLPQSVLIVTEDESVTEAQVIWNLDDLADGSYDPENTTEQHFQLNGTVVLPSSISNDDHISLKITILIMVSEAGHAGEPKVNLKSGTYTNNLVITLASETEGATIYYTMNGSTPTVTSTKYTSPILVSGIRGNPKSVVIKAIAVKKGLQSSKMVEFVYDLNIPVPPNVIQDSGLDRIDTEKTEVSNPSTDEVLIPEAEEKRELPNYQVAIESDVIEKNEDYTINISGDMSKLIGITVDEDMITEDQYRVDVRASTVTLRKEYINTLPVGKHTIKINFENGSAKVIISIKEKDDKRDNPIVQSSERPINKPEIKEQDLPGKETTSFWWLWLLIIILAGICYRYYYLKKKNRKQ
ncbi:large exoprotein [Lachnospiraceae bacterium KM106-2]|nr:large exoprotein [Lachnospiraceae bacterium KM106-2]